MVSLHCTLPWSGDFLEPGKPADLWECSLGFSKNSEVFLVGKTTLSINSCLHYLLGLTATLNLCTAFIITVVLRGDTFRAVLSRVGEIRSLLPRGVNVMAVTATAMH